MLHQIIYAWASLFMQTSVADELQIHGGNVPAQITVEAKHLTQERVKKTGLRVSAYLADSDQLRAYSSADNARLAVQVAQRSLCLNELRPSVWNKCKVFFKGDGTETGSGRTAFRTNSTQSFDFLKTLTDEATGRGVEIAPWVQYGFKVTASDKCSIYTQKRGKIGWLMEDRQHKDTFDFNNVPIAYMNPANPEVVQFLKEMFVGIVRAHPSIKKVVIDDNFAWNPRMGYDDFTKKLFTHDHPEVKWPPVDHNPTWMKWRSDKVRDAILEVKMAMRQASPKVRLLLSSNPPPHAYKDSLQDPQKWLEQGVVDQIETQIFRDDSDGVMKSMDQKVKEDVKTALSSPSIGQTIRNLTNFAARQLGPRTEGTALLAGNRYKNVPAFDLMLQLSLAESKSSDVSFFHLDSMLRPIPGETMRGRVKLLQNVLCDPHNQ